MVLRSLPLCYGSPLSHPFWTPFQRHMNTLIKQSLIIAVTVVATAPFSPWAMASMAGPVDSNTVDIQAAQQQYDPESNSYHLGGNVVVTYKDYKIFSNQADMAIDETGEPSTANFYPRPTAKKFKPATENSPALEDEVIGDILLFHLQRDLFTAKDNVISTIRTVASNPFTIRSDVQEFDNVKKIITASGNVDVDYGESKATSANALLRIGSNGRAERVIFTGGARLAKKGTDVKASKITVMIGSGDMMAESAVRTTVKMDDNRDALILSDYQQYDKSSGKMIATGHVKIDYGDYLATGPKAVFNLIDGSVDTIDMVGRSTIVEKERTIVADKITITTNPTNFDAVGNVKIQFQAKNGATQTASSGAPAQAQPKQPAKQGGPLKFNVKNNNSGESNPPEILPEDDIYNY